MPAQLTHAVAVCTLPKRLAALRLLLRQQTSSISAAIVFARADRPLAKLAAALAGALEDEPPAIRSEEVKLKKEQNSDGDA